MDVSLENYATKQAVLKTAAITSVPCEFALVELEDAASAQAVAEIFQARIDAQINGGSPRPSWRGCCPRPETP